MILAHTDETPHTARRFSLALGFSFLIHGLLIAPVFFLEETTVWSVGIPITFEFESPAANSPTPAEITSSHVAAAKTPKASTRRAQNQNHTKPTPRTHARKPATEKRSTERANNELTHSAAPTESQQAATTVAAGSDLDYHPPRYRIGSAQNPIPDYPYVAQLEGWKGRVVLQVKVDTDGQALEVNVHQSSGYDVLDQAARETIITRWIFTPAQRKGRAVVAQADVSFRFELIEQ